MGFPDSGNKFVLFRVLLVHFKPAFYRANATPSAKLYLLRLPGLQVTESTFQIGLHNKKDLPASVQEAHLEGGLQHWCTSGFKVSSNTRFFYCFPLPSGCQLLPRSNCPPFTLPSTLWPWKPASSNKATFPHSCVRGPAFRRTAPRRPLTYVGLRCIPATERTLVSPRNSMC